MDQDQKWMRVALKQAELGLGRTAPNPCVGAVIVKNGELVGKGYHRKAGGPHAEVEAIRDAGEAAIGATCLVTLEPCCFHGRTPACTDALIRAGVSRVVFAVRDPNPKVAGRGSQILQEAGIEVKAGVCEEDAAFLNRHFFHFIQEKTPFVTWKYAMTADGKIATHTGESKWITGVEARKEVQHLRFISDAILVGAGTVRADNPALTLRLEGEPKELLRVILDDRKGLGPNFEVFQSGETRPTMLFSNFDYCSSDLQSFNKQGVEVVSSPGPHELRAILETLARRDIVHLMVEGGSQVLGSFLAERLVQEIWAFIGSKLIGGQAAPGPVGGLGVSDLSDAMKLSPFETRQSGLDVLVKYTVGG